MKSVFAHEYAESLRIFNMYEEAKSEGSTKGMEQAHKAFKAHNESVEEKGTYYFYLYGRYEKAMELGNAQIDLCDPYLNAIELVKAFREYDIDSFTLSSTWSSSNETAWAFLQNGCTLQGMVEVNISMVDYEGQQEKRPAYLFKVN